MIPGTLLVVVALVVATLSSVAEAFKGRCGQQPTEMTPPSMASATAVPSSSLAPRNQAPVLHLFA